MGNEWEREGVGGEAVKKPLGKGKLLEGKGIEEIEGTV